MKPMILLSLTLLSISSAQADIVVSNGKTCISHFPTKESLTCEGDGMHGWGKADGLFVIEKIEKCKQIESRKVCVNDQVIVHNDKDNGKNNHKLIKLTGIVTTKLKTYNNGIWFYGYEMVNGVETGNAVSEFNLTQSAGPVPGAESIIFGEKTRNTKGEDDVVVYRVSNESRISTRYGIRPLGSTDVIDHTEEQFRFRFFNGPSHSKSFQGNILVTLPKKNVKEVLSKINDKTLSDTFKESAWDCHNLAPYSALKISNLVFKTSGVEVEKIKGSWGGKILPEYTPTRYEHYVNVSATYDCTF